MKARRVISVYNYLSPGAPEWGQMGTTAINMAPTLLAMQPTEYIRKSWKNKPYGLTTKNDVASVHDGEMWAVRRFRSTGPS